MTINKKLQIKFILITMLAVIIIVIGVFAVVTLENYKMNNKQLDLLLDFISENDGYMPEKKDKKYNYLADEALYSTRYFSIKLDENGKIIDINLDNIASVEKEEAIEISKEVLKNSKNIGTYHKLANSILENKKVYGFFSNYKYKINSINKGKLIVFIECETELQTFKIATIRSFTVTCIGIIIIFILLIMASKKILNPVFKSIESQKNFVTNASHEFKTPLAVIMADIDILEMTVGEDDEWLNSIKNQTHRLNTLTKTLLTLSNIQDGKASLETSKFSINEVINEEIEELKILIGERKVNFEPKSDFIMSADKNMIKQVVNILLDNAIKYTPEDGKINIVTRF